MQRVNFGILDSLTLPTSPLLNEDGVQYFDSRNISDDEV
jgi:hypothetical protein